MPIFFFKPSILVPKQQVKIFFVLRITLANDFFFRFGKDVIMDLKYSISDAELFL